METHALWAWQSGLAMPVSMGLACSKAVSKNIASYGPVFPLLQPQRTWYSKFPALVGFQIVRLLYSFASAIRPCSSNMRLDATLERAKRTECKTSCLRFPCFPPTEFIRWFSFGPPIGASSLIKVDMKTNITLANRATYRTFGYDQDDLSSAQRIPMVLMDWTKYAE